MKRFISFALLLCMLMSAVPMTAAAEPVQSGETVTVCFDSMGGSDVAPVQTVKGKTVQRPQNPTKDGFLFAGWTLNGVPYDFDTAVEQSMTLKALWSSDTVPSRTVDTATLQLDPGYLELWQGMTLKMNMQTTVNVTRSDGYKYVRFFAWSVPVEYYVLDSSVAEVDQSGNVTAKKLGTTYMWAVVKQDCNASFEGTDVCVQAGGVLGAVEICVVSEPEYYRAFKADPENQQITLAANTQRDTSLFTSMPSDAFGSANIALWYGSANAAFTMTVDDNLMGDFARWREWSEQFGIPVTFFAPTALYYECADKWLEQIAYGQDVQSHSRYHNSSAEYADVRTSAQDWADLYYGAQDIRNSGIDPLVIGYPCGYNAAELSRMLYISGRGGASRVNGMDINYNLVSSFSGFGGAAGKVETLGSSVGAWMCVHYHSIGSSEAVTEEKFALLKQQTDAGTVWATTYAAAAQYGQERDTAAVTVKSTDSEKGTVVFGLTDRMNDSLFYQPLTVRVTVDGTWTSAHAYQAGVERQVELVCENGKYYAEVDAVPDAGDVVLMRQDVSVRRDGDDVFFTVSDCGDYGRLPVTVGFEVPHDGWRYVTATQGAETLHTRYETKQGADMLYVTAYSNGGEVTVTPTDGTELSSHTMTQIYNREVKPSSEKNITISDARELCLLSEYVNSGADTSGLTFVLTCDIDMSGVWDFRPIGWMMEYEKSSANRYYTPFCGTFDGDCHTISGLEINRRVCGAGLFGYISEGTVCNLDLRANVRGIKRVGGVAGDLVNGTLLNVSFSGTVTSTATQADRNGGCYTGGLVGRVRSAVIENCPVTDTVINTYAALPVSKTRNSYDGYSGAAVFNTGNDVGGIVGGFNTNIAAGTTTSIVNNCIFRGSICAHTAEDDTGTVYGGSAVGGIAGIGTMARITNCFVNATVCGYENVGGIYGYHQSAQLTEIINCAAYGEISAAKNAGGLTGYTGENGNAALKNCFSGVTDVSAGQNAGAAIGYLGTVNRNPNPTGIYYSGAADTVPANCAEGASGTFVHATAEQALTALNTYAAANSLSSWSESDGEITPTHLPIYRVTFLGREGEVVCFGYVPHGLAAQVPEAPSYTGYRFSGWSDDTSCVSSDMTVTALYDEIEVYTVTFVGRDGEVIKCETVNSGGSATPPEAPDSDGYVFVRWNGEYTAVKENVTVRAEYVTGYTVTFYGINGAVISRVKVAQGADATAPAVPVVDKYHFTGWDRGFSGISENTEVCAVYAPNSSDATTAKVLTWNVMRKGTGKLNGTALDTYYAQFGDADIVITTGCDVIELPDDSVFGISGKKTSRGASEGYGFNIAYRKAKYRVDTSAEEYLNITCKWTDIGVYALPLTDTATGKQVVAVSMFTGAFSKTDATNLTSAIKFMFGELTPIYPGAEAVIVGLHMESPDTKGGSVSKQAVFDATKNPYSAEYTLSCLHEADRAQAEAMGVSGTTEIQSADYLLTYTKSAMTVSQSSAVSVIDGGTDFVDDGHLFDLSVTDPSEFGKIYHVVTFTDTEGYALENRTVEAMTPAVPPEAPAAPAGYVFAGWSAELGCVTENMSVHPLYEVMRHTVTFADSLGNVIEVQKVEHGHDAVLPTPPEHSGYTFAGWDTDTITDVCSDMTVTALYTPLSITLTFVPGDGSAPIVVTAPAGSLLVLPELPEKDGYVYDGWMCGSERFTADEMPTADMTLTTRVRVDAARFMQALKCLTEAREPMQCFEAIKDAEALLGMWSEQDKMQLDSEALTSYITLRDAFSAESSGAAADLRAAEALASALFGAKNSK